MHLPLGVLFVFDILKLLRQPPVHHGVMFEGMRITGSCEIVSSFDMNEMGVDQISQAKARFPGQAQGLVRVGHLHGGGKLH